MDASSRVAEPAEPRQRLRSIAALPGHREQRQARLALLGVAVLWFLVHALLAGFARAVNWDESIHLSQVVPGRLANFLEPHRTRGVSLLVAPIAVFDPPMILLRAYLAAATGVGLLAAFGTWVRTIGLAAPLAALLFACFQVTTFYGVEVLPNLPTALLGVAIAGLAARAALEDEAVRIRSFRDLRSPSLRTLPVAAASCMLVLALVRPPDAFLLGVGIAVAITVVRARAAAWFVPATAAGGVLGLLPWFIESATRFGFGPLDTVRSGGDYSTNVEVFNRFPIIVRSLEDTVRCGHTCEREILASGSLWALPGWRTTAFLGVGLALTVVAVLRDGRRRAPAALAALAALPLLAFYSFTTLINMRYLLPVIALWLVPPSIGAVLCWRWAGRREQGTLLRAVAALLLVSAVWWQWGLGIERLESGERRERARQLGEAVAERAEGPCVIATQDARPMVQYWSGCHAVTLLRGEDGDLQDPLGELDSYVDLAGRQRQGYEVFALAPTGYLSDNSPVLAWEPEELRGGRIDGYVLYRHRPGDPLPDPPCPPPNGPKRMLGGVLSDDC
jgi:hypothetical protein